MTETLNMENCEVLSKFNSEQLVIALIDRDLCKLSDDLKSIILFKLSSSLNTSLQTESHI